LRDVESECDQNKHAEQDDLPAQRRVRALSAPSHERSEDRKQGVKGDLDGEGPQLRQIRVVVVMIVCLYQQHVLQIV